MRRWHSIGPHRRVDCNSSPQPLAILAQLVWVKEWQGLARCWISGSQPLGCSKVEGAADSEAKVNSTLASLSLGSGPFSSSIGL